MGDRQRGELYERHPFPSNLEGDDSSSPSPSASSSSNLPSTGEFSSHPSQQHHYHAADGSSSYTMFTSPSPSLSSTPSLYSMFPPMQFPPMPTVPAKKKFYFHQYQPKGTNEGGGGGSSGRKRSPPFHRDREKDSTPSRKDDDEKEENVGSTVDTSTSTSTTTTSAISTATSTTVTPSNTGVDFFIMHDNARTLTLTSEMLNRKQSDIAKELNMSTSFLSKRWRAATNGRKWPYRTICKIENEIRELLTVPDHMQLDDTKRTRLKKLELMRDHLLVPVDIITAV